MLEHLDENRCTGCKICVDVCPEDVLRFDEDRKKPFVAYPEDCLGCGACAWFCPRNCIEVSIDRARQEEMAY
ncbi:MAG TPA: ferredoxin family protein [Desulfatiglandales bacterium]|nr:ferredoxin family protein [Desulfatiglandales bacterium]